MTGLFTGIIGSLIGAGIQAVGGIPIREDASKALDVLRHGGLPVPPPNWFSTKSSNEQSTQQVSFDKIGQHVVGTMQVLGPCMQIAKTFQDVAYPRSQPPPVKAWTSREEFVRSCKSAEVNDPQLLLAGTMTNVRKECESKCLRLPVATSSTRFVNSPNTKNCKPREKITPESIKSIENKKKKKTEDNILRKENGKKGRTDPREREMKADKFLINAGVSKNSKCRPFCPSSTVKAQSPILKSQTKLCKPQNNSGKPFRGEKCLICHAQIKQVKRPPLMPCGHKVCYQCLAGQTLFKCPKCGLKFK